MEEIAAACGAEDWSPTATRPGTWFSFTWARELSLIGSTMHPDQDLPAIMQAVGKRALRGVVDRVFPLKEAAEAHLVLESNDFFGKLILVP